VEARAVPTEIPKPTATWASVSCRLEQVVAADVVLVTEGGEGRHADAEPGQPVQQRDAHTSGLHRHTRCARTGVVGGERGVEPDGLFGVGDAEAVRADEAHAIRAACGQERPCLGTVQAGGDDDEGPDSRLAALLGESRYGGGGRGDHHEVGGEGQGADGGVCMDAQDGGGVRVHGEQASCVAARVEVVQESPPHRTGFASGADDSDRLRPQQRLQAGHVGRPATGLHCREVRVVLVEVDGAAHLRPLEAPRGAQTEVGEEP
jgi:hypothetical protein